MSELIAAGLSLLRRQEEAKTGFVGSLEAAEAGAEHEGWHSLDDVLAEADRITAARRDAA